MSNEQCCLCGAVGHDSKDCRMRAEFEREVNWGKLNFTERNTVEKLCWGWWQKAWQAARAQPAGEAVAYKAGRHAIRYRDNWDGEGDIYHLIAILHEDGSWTEDETGKKLLEYEGDEILQAWPLLTAPPAQVPVNQRLLDVAQAILAEDMIPLLPPEYVERVKLVIADAKNQPACVSNDYVAGIEAVAKMIDKKADDYADQFGYVVAGGLSFGGGIEGEIKRDTHSGLIELAEEIRALAPAQPTQQAAQVPDGWISVAERLPEEQDIYLGMLREDNPLGWTWKRPTEVAFGYLPHDRQRFSVFDPWAHENVDIQDSMTHWMPLPAPPTPTGGE